MRKYRKHRDVVIEKLKNDVEYRNMYMQLALEEYQEESNMQSLLLSLRYVAEALGGVPELSKKTNIAKTSLYKVLSENGNPKLDTVNTILNGLGYKIQVVPVEHAIYSHTS